MSQLVCPYHPHGELVEDWRAGDIICRECGRVAGERMIDVSSEWRDFGNDSDSPSKSRVGAAQSRLYDTANLETVIMGKISSSMSNESSLSKSNHRTSQPSPTDKALRTAHDAIRDVASRIGLRQRVTDQAFLTYKKCYESKLLRGRAHNVYVAACIYMACRKEGSTRTIDEIASDSAVSSLEISRAYRKLMQHLPKSSEPKMIQLSDLIPRFCSRLTLAQPALIRSTAMHIAERAKEVCDIQGRKPSSVAGAAIYLACLASSEQINRKNIHNAVGASEAVVRTVYQLLLPHASQLFPSNFAFKCPISRLPSA